MSVAEIQESSYHIFQSIQFISEEQIKQSSWDSAAKILHDIDPNDTPYLAFAKHFRCKIWSGDRQLAKGLHKKGINLILNTEEVYHLRTKYEAKKRR